MNTQSNAAKAEQNQPNNSSNDTVISPDLSHRYLSLTYGTTMENLAETIDYSTLRITSQLNLIRKLFSNDSSGSLKHEMIYYSFVTAKMDIDDMKAVIGAFQEETAMDGPGDSQADNLTPQTDFLTSINEIIIRASGILSLLCDRFLRDDVSRTNNEMIVGAIDSVVREITNIGDFATDYRYSTDNQA